MRNVFPNNTAEISFWMNSRQKYTDEKQKRPQYIELKNSLHIYICGEKYKISVIGFTVYRKTAKFEK